MMLVRCTSCIPLLPAHSVCMCVTECLDGFVSCFLGRAIFHLGYYCSISSPVLNVCDIVESCNRFSSSTHNIIIIKIVIVLNQTSCCSLLVHGHVHVAVLIFRETVLGINIIFLIGNLGPG